MLQLRPSPPGRSFLRMRARAGIARWYGYVEDVVYVGLGILLAATVLLLLVSGFIKFGSGAVTWQIVSSVSGLLDQILLVLLVVELLYTVQVSFREHSLVPEPFLLVGIISVIRRILVITATLGEMNQAGTEPARGLVLELAVLGGMVVALAVSLMLLRRKNDSADAGKGLAER